MVSVQVIACPLERVVVLDCVFDEFCTWRPDNELERTNSDYHRYYGDKQICQNVVQLDLKKEKEKKKRNHMYTYFTVG